jgi:hypothetical protein
LTPIFTCRYRPGPIWTCQYLLGLTIPFYNLKLSENARFCRRTLGQSAHGRRP